MNVAFIIPKPVSTRWSYVFRTLDSFLSRVDAVWDPVSSAYRQHLVNKGDSVPGLDALADIMTQRVQLMFLKVRKLLGHYEKAIRHLEGTLLV